MSVARRLAGESSGWMSFPWPDPTDRRLKGDSPAEVQSLSLVAGRGGWQRGGKAILTLVKKCWLLELVFANCHRLPLCSDSASLRW
jgi:hypothetical protein